MSILVECLTLIATPAVIEERYPGGVDGWLARCAEPDHPSRYALADDELVAVSLYAPEDVRAEIEHLESFDIRYVVDGECRDVCLIDQEGGFVMPCCWIEWKVDDELGFTHAWPMYADPGEQVTVWDGWTPEESLALTRTDPRADPDRMMRLSREEDGIETWLDFHTGHLVVGPVTEEESIALDVIRSLPRNPEPHHG